MGYYMAGDYYRAGGARNYAAGGWLSSLGKVAKSVGTFIGGPVGGAIGLAGGVLDRPAAPAAPVAPTFGVTGARVPTAAQASRGVEAVGVSPLGTVGVAFKKKRHMNVGNAKAAHRAVRRITGVRHLLQSIEKELPRRPAIRNHGSPGTITRAEAARALRS